jgi:uncharacterized protein
MSGLRWQGMAVAPKFLRPDTGPVVSSEKKRMHPPVSSLNISSLYVYPIKSCAGIELDTATLGRRGISYDREWMVVDSDGGFVTQRTIPAMALIKPRVHGQELSLVAPGMNPLTIETGDSRPVVRVSVWDDVCDARDEGEAAAEWLSTFLGENLRLVRMTEGNVRHVDPDYATGALDEVGFADGYPLLVISKASLDDLNDRLDQPVPMDRFRPNLVVDGALAYEEDSWRTIRIGDIVMHAAKPCARCVVTTVDQRSGEVGKEPLRTLSTYRRVGVKVLFGQNFAHVRTGAVRLGGTVEVLARKPLP